MRLLFSLVFTTASVCNRKSIYPIWFSLTLTTAVVTSAVLGHLWTRVRLLRNKKKNKSHVMNKKADANLWCPGKQHGGRLAWSECEQPRDESCWQRSMNRTNTAHQRTSQFADTDEAHLHPAPYKTTGSVCVPGTRWGFAGFMAISPPQHKLQVRSFKLIVKVAWGLILERNSPTLQVRPASMNNSRLKIKEWNGKN